MKSKILAILVIGLVAGSMSAGAAPITYNVLFTGSTPLPSGTITFADGSDPDIGTGTVLLSALTYTFSFSDGTSIWTEHDRILLPPTEGPIPTATFVAGTLVGLDLSVQDDDPIDTLNSLRLFYTNTSNSRVWRTNVFGTYYFEEVEVGVPEPGTLVLLGLGLAGLGLTRRRKV